MNIDKFNSEGYYDPTSYEAMTNVAKADNTSIAEKIRKRNAIRKKY